MAGRLARQTAAAEIAEGREALMPDRIYIELERLIERVERDRREPDKLLCHLASAKRALTSQAPDLDDMVQGVNETHREGLRLADDDRVRAALASESGEGRYCEGCKAPILDNGLCDNCGLPPEPAAAVPDCQPQSAEGEDWPPFIVQRFEQDDPIRPHRYVVLDGTQSTDFTNCRRYIPAPEGSEGDEVVEHHRDIRKAAEGKTDR